MPKDKDDDALEAALAKMAPIISHEIRNPLAIIGNSSYFIKTKLSKQGELDPKVTRHFTIIETELKHANDVLGEILAYTRMPEAKKAPHALTMLVEAALAATPAPEGVKIQKSLKAGDLKVSVDGEMTATVLHHLIRNAFGALSPDGTKTSGSVKIATSKDGEKWGVVEISDSGPGIPAEAEAKLYTPFNTTRPRGVGVGL
ncbi:MAG: ATP-binding protein, partial [Elusimicrobiota bacterium]